MGFIIWALYYIMLYTIESPYYKAHTMFFYIVWALTPKVLWLVFSLFLKFGQAILVRTLMLNF